MSLLGLYFGSTFFSQALSVQNLKTGPPVKQNELEFVMDFFKSNCTRLEARDLDDCLGMLDSD